MSLIKEKTFSQWLWFYAKQLEALNGPQSCEIQKDVYWEPSSYTLGAPFKYRRKFGFKQGHTAQGKTKVIFVCPKWIKFQVMKLNQIKPFYEVVEDSECRRVWNFIFRISKSSSTKKNKHTEHFSCIVVIGRPECSKAHILSPPCHRNCIQCNKARRSITGWTPRNIVYCIDILHGRLFRRQTKSSLTNWWTSWVDRSVQKLYSYTSYNSVYWMLDWKLNNGCSSIIWIYFVLLFMQCSFIYLYYSTAPCVVLYVVIMPYMFHSRVL